MKSKVLLITLVLLSLIASTSIAFAATKPTVTFTADHTSGYAPLGVTFTSHTTGKPTSYFWVFEPQTSSDWNSHHAVSASHTFKNPGVYTISCVVSNAAGTVTYTRQSYITVYAKPKVVKPVAAYGISSSSGYLPWTVHFTDLSTGNPTHWYWNFDDGYSSTQRNPTHTFYNPPIHGGHTYHWTLTVSNAAGSDTAYGASKIINGLPNIVKSTNSKSNAILVNA